MRTPTAIALAALILCAVATERVLAADPDALWKIVSGACIPHTVDGSGGTPCTLVDLAKGYVVLKDRNGATQFLVMPVDKVTGIESPEILAPGAPLLWADAWAARHFVDERAGRQLPRDAISLAVNSMYGRSQNQLHIHVDCIRADVRDALRAHQAGIGETWAPLPVAFGRHIYLARRLAQPDLGDADPFRLLADGLPVAGADMSRETLVVTGAIFADRSEGFWLLADRVDATQGDRASGEELQDHACALAHAAE